jgi:hypothetical protein
MKNSLWVAAFLWVSLAFGSHVRAQAPEIPHLQARTRVRAERTGDVVTYTYQLENLDSKQEILSFSVDVRSSPSRVLGTVQDLQARTPVADRITGLNLDLLGAENVTQAVPTAAPSGWDAALSADASFEFRALDDGGMVAPATAVLFAFQSRGLPTIREGRAHPNNFSSLPNFEESDLTEEEYFGALDAADYHFMTIGPLPPPVAFDPRLFLGEILDLRSRAELLGWVKPSPALQRIDSILTELDASLGAASVSRSRQLILHILMEIEGNACREFSCAAEKPFSSEGYALLALNLRFLEERLPPSRNTPPVAEAGPDRIVQCTSLEQTSVELDGGGSSDAEGDPLTYEWTGVFGNVNEKKPVVSLPLGPNEVLLRVADGEFASSADRAVITVVPEIQGFEPPMSKLVLEADGQGGGNVETPRFSAGRTIPLKVMMRCGGETVARIEDAPSIVSLLRNGAAISTSELNDGDLRFRLAGKKWILNFSTKRLASGTYRMGVYVSGLTYQTEFVLQ